MDCPFKRGIYCGSDLPEASGAKGVLPYHDLGFTGAVQVAKVVFILHSKYCRSSNNLVFTNLFYSKPQTDMMHMMRIMTGSLQHMIE